jgi:hypothetical protein
MITDIRTPLAIADRYKQSRGEDLTNAFKAWKPWIPPKLSQGLQQGGAFVFEGRSVLFARKDPATGSKAYNSGLLYAMEFIIISGVRWFYRRSCKSRGSAPHCSVSFSEVGSIVKLYR